MNKEIKRRPQRGRLFCLRKKGNPIKKNFERNELYRSEFIRSHPRKTYFCVYCGRPVSKRKMQVDHIVAVNLVKRKKFYRKFIHKDINELSNLVPACPHCNKRKSDKGGLWILRGKFWKLFLPCTVMLKLFILGCILSICIFGCYKFPI